MAPSNYNPKIIEIDEIYIKIQGKRELYGWLAYDTENKCLIDFVTGRRDDDTLEKLFKKTYALFGQPKQSVEDKMYSLGLGRKITTALIENLNFHIRF